MTHLPLNGDALLNRAASAMRPSAADLIRFAIEAHPDEAPDGTGAGTKSRTAGAPKSRATDPSQGHGGYHRPAPKDPLLDALVRTVNRR